MDDFNEELYLKLKQNLIRKGVDRYEASITAEKVADIGCETVREALNEMYKENPHKEIETSYFIS